ncbi:putative TraK protein (plasmid) [Solidesulfovibrio carbinoliphilus subsp. oakridgensis]|uniref:TraK protein n=1 Tax=Solidesulfovibrio carbinoliphilus subsp. oakridgensis TaxID=694327 RepID=G7QEA8_9BACT|nr:TraK family protein [Solidesulfovibrio carbinoliphilus]EHJ46002.1 putative TraK protein [Solidesulfovibrio carbinoliphilus subsp. oakridgensis]
MSDNVHRIDRCMGRVEFRACEAEILDMHQKGYANKHIYKKLAEDGKLTLAYSTFNGHLRKLLQPKNPKATRDNQVEVKKTFTVRHDTELV